MPRPNTKPSAPALHPFRDCLLISSIAGTTIPNTTFSGEIPTPESSMHNPNSLFPVGIKNGLVI